MKVLLFSDFHFHTWSKWGVNSDGKWKRFVEQEEALEQIENIIQTERIEKVIFGGDWFHKYGEIPVECVNRSLRFFEKLKKWGVKFYLTSGEHDVARKESPDWVHIALYDLKGGIETGIKLVNVYDDIDVEKIKDYEFVVLHKTPLMKPWAEWIKDCIDWGKLAKQNKWVFFGHIHFPARLARNCVVMGSVMDLNFDGNTAEKGVYVVEKYDIKFVPIKAPKFRIVKKASEIKDDYNYYKIVEAVDSSEVLSSKVVAARKQGEVYEEKLKGGSLEDIAKEWLDISGIDDKEKYFRAIKDELVEGRRVKVYSGRLTKVEIRDFMSFANVQFSLQKGVNFIYGWDERGESNGVGKSSLMEAVYWCLFGRTTKWLTGKDVVRDGQKEACVRLKFDDGIEIERTTSKGVSVYSLNLVYKELTEGLRKPDRDKYVETYLGIDNMFFLASCYFAQENLVMLTTMGAAPRTALVADLLGFQRFDDLYTLCLQKKGEWEKRHAEVRDNIISQETVIKTKKEALEEWDGLIEDSDRKIKELGEHAEKVKFEISKLNQELGELRLVEIDLSGFEKSLVELREMIEGVSGKEEQLLNEKLQLSRKAEELKSQMRVLDTEIVYRDKEREKLKKEIESLKNLNFGERCDKCGAVISEDNVKAFVKEKQERIKEIEGQIGEFVEKKKEVVKEFDEANSELRKNGERQAKLKEKKKFLQEEEKTTKLKLEEERAKAEKQKIKAVELKEEISGKEDLLLQIHKSIEAEKERVFDLEKKRDELKVYIDNAEQGLKEFEEEALKAEKMIDIYEFWKGAFGKKGIRSYLVDRFCNEFNRIVNGYLSIIAQGRIVVWAKPYGTTKAGEERKRIEFEIIKDGVQRKYEALSGGEKRRVDVASCLALAEWVRQRNGLESNFLGVMVFDEVFSFVDKQGEEGIAEALAEEARKKGVAIYIISHTAEIGSYADGKLLLRKERGVSYVSEYSLCRR